MGLIFKLPLSWCTMTSANIITFSHHTTYSTQHSHDSKRWCPIIYFDEKVSLLVTFSANSSFGLLRNFLSSWFPFYFKLVNQKKKWKRICSKSNILFSASKHCSSQSQMNVHGHCQFHLTFLCAEGYEWGPSKFTVLANFI